MVVKASWYSFVGNTTPTNVSISISTTLLSVIDRTITDSVTTTNYPANSVENSRAVDGVLLIAIVIGIIIALITVLTAAAIIFTVVHKKMYTTKQDYDTSYSALSRASAQRIQPQSLNAPTDLYDQIQLSPSTGQAEFVSKAEIENINSPPPQVYDTHPTVDTDQPKSATETPKLRELNLSPHDADNSTPEQPTDAVINIKNKEKVGNKSVKDNKAEESNQKVQKQVLHGENETATQISLQLHEVESLEMLYTDVKTKSENSAMKETPPVALHAVEELYTSVKKKQKSITAESDEAASPIPTHTIDELYAAVKKGSAATDEEEAPLIPPHTVEELYTAVKKKTKGSAIKNEEATPPIPPYNAEELSVVVKKKKNLKHWTAHVS